MTDRITGSGHPLEGRIVRLPGPDNETGMILHVEHEGDDGATLRYVSGPSAGLLTMRDTWAVKTWEVVG